MNRSKINLKHTRREKERCKEESEEEVGNAQCIAFNEADYLSSEIPIFLINSVSLNNNILGTQQNGLQSDFVGKKLE